ncbi:MAG: hypothetical protein IH589_16445 [Anaerolineales bacterium]|nr:hypothetical protein [Anaerolineales bacterium]
MFNTKLFSKPGFYIALGVYFLIGYLTLFFGERAAELLFDEDHYFENVGAISLFIASSVSFYTFFLLRKVHRKQKVFWGKQLVYLSLALLYFFGGGEEISWGQRIFGISTPTNLVEENVQGELNVHNLAVFENSTLLKADNIFSIFWLGFAVLVPFGSLLFDRFRRVVSTWMPVVHWGIGVLFLGNYILADLAKRIFISSYTSKLVPFVQAVQEIKESNYEFLFIFLALFVYWDFSEKNSDLKS